MAINIKKWSLVSLFLVSSPILAATHTADFSDFASHGSQRDVITDVVDGKTVSATAWSDTLNEANVTGDKLIEQARYMQRYGSGWGIRNFDEGTGSPAHSADNLGTSAWKDYDFFMLSFEHAVELSKATFSWIYDSPSNTQLSIVALDANMIDANGGDIDGLTWQQINDSYSIGSGYSTVQNDSGYYIDIDVDSQSTYWLVGAFNSVFSGNSNWEGNDGFKLSSVSYDKKRPNQEVPEPSSIAILALALIGLYGQARRKQA